MTATASSVTCAVLAAAVLVAVGVFHVYWALGGRWPGHDEASLARHVLGAAGPPVMPPPVLTGVLAIAFFALAWALLAWIGIAPVPPGPPWILRVCLYLGTGVFALRGVVGFFDQRIRPGDATAPFVRLNRIFYSPLCLLVAGLLFGALAT